MPRPRKYATRAEQLAAARRSSRDAYRRRREAAGKEVRTYARHIELPAEAPRRYTPRLPPHARALKHTWHQMVARAREKSLPCDLSLDDVVALWEAQQGRCAVTGEPLSVEVGHPRYRVNPRRLAADRVVPSLGYVRGNVRLVCHWFNVAKADIDDADMLALARALVARHDAPLPVSSV